MDKGFSDFNRESFKSGLVQQWPNKGQSPRRVIVVGDVKDKNLLNVVFFFVDGGWFGWDVVEDNFGAMWGWMVQMGIRVMTDDSFVSKGHGVTTDRGVEGG